MHVPVIMSKMKILVVGGSRGLGKQTVKMALQDGHEVTAFSRNPSSLNIDHPKLSLHSGNVLEMSSLEKAIQGHDAVICALGLPTLKAIGPPFAKRSYVLSKGTENILKVMDSSGIKRFICVTAIGTRESAKQCTPVARFIFRYGLRWLFKEKDRQEKLIENSATDWTIIRPTALTNGRKKGSIVTKNFRSGILTHVSRPDVADVMIDIVDKPGAYKKALIVTYQRRVGDSIRWAIGYLGIK